MTTALADRSARFFDAVRRFRWQGRRCQREDLCGVPVFVNEFWTAQQRQAHSLHEISYRACFKPQLPRFFIDRLSRAGERVYDPFSGRGTTALEAALAGRCPAANDANPLSAHLLWPRLEPPEQAEVARRVERIDLSRPPEVDRREDLLVFYHPETLAELAALRSYLLWRERWGRLDAVDRWIRMVALNRLTGHSPGFFSVYTLPPNQAVTPAAQRKINARRGQTPPRRPIKERILRKSRSLLRNADRATRSTLSRARPGARLLTAPAEATGELASGSVDLVVTSPPFLDVVDYATDNWLRCWFAGIDPEHVRLTVPRGLDAWTEAMSEVFRELLRVVRPGGHVCFEVGEVRGGRLRLEEAVVPCARAAGFEPLLVMINDQHFTKTANCWGVVNRRKGTNTNRIVVLRRP
ncbi:MAG: site-specific DNA-methyltransferase [Planctomycetota bacterium]|nr:MAG: site-specific DNA-methyltransferase [Planctomycetota bacterium]